MHCDFHGYEHHLCHHGVRCSGALRGVISCLSSAMAVLSLARSRAGQPHPDESEQIGKQYLENEFCKHLVAEWSVGRDLLEWCLQMSSIASNPARLSTWGCRKAWLLPLGHPTSKPDCNGGKHELTSHSLSSATTTRIQVEANQPSAQLQYLTKQALEAKGRPKRLAELGKASTRKTRMIKGHYGNLGDDLSELDNCLVQHIARHRPHEDVPTDASGEESKDGLQHFVPDQHAEG